MSGGLQRFGNVPNFYRFLVLIASLIFCVEIDTQFQSSIINTFITIMLLGVNPSLLRVVHLQWCKGEGLATTNTPRKSEGEGLAHSFCLHASDKASLINVNFRRIRHKHFFIFV